VDPLNVVVTRGADTGEIVEARHRVHAVGVHDGRIVLAAGDPGLFTYLRSSAKPIQALPLLRSRPDLGDSEIAIACASHLARPEQLAAVRRLLAAAPADEDELECGPEPTRLEHNCSGKHAGFLAVCRVRGWKSRGYRLPEHPLQRELRSEVAAAAEVEPDSVPIGVDGCGVPTFALTLERIASLFSQLAALDGAPRALAAMRAHPDLIRGPQAADSMLMRAVPGWTAKGGAEGLLCACSDDGIGLVLKVEDGDQRAVRSGLAEALRRLGVDPPEELGVVSVENSRGEPVGSVRSEEPESS
jgi:L-asparaginase II